jgi:hypothetical protein
VRFFILQRSAPVLPELVYCAYFRRSLTNFGLNCKKLKSSNFNPPAKNQKNYLENLFGFRVVHDLALTEDDYRTKNLAFDFGNGIAFDLTEYFEALFRCIAGEKAKKKKS